ncbi:MAG TPA: hypothetical protein VFZ58_02845 [Candidatus Saccharimonadales bacterium]
MKVVRHWLWRYRDQLLAVGGYGIVLLAIVLPWLAPGFILTLDMVFASPMPMPSAVHSGFLFYALLHWVSLVMPADVMQKLLLIGFFLLSGWSGYSVARGMLKNVAPLSAATKVAAFAAGLFYMVNPFVYSRLMAGQFALLLAYAVLPFAFHAAWKLCNAPSLAKAAQLTGVLVALSILSLHIFGMALIMLGIGFLVFLWQARKQPTNLKQLVLWFGGSLVAWAVGSSYWLWPLLSGTGQEAAQITSFTSDHAAVFQTLGGATSALLLQGFWADLQSLYLMPQDLYDGWWLPLLLLLPLVALGFFTLWQHMRALAVWATIALVTGAILAAGVSDPIFGNLNRWLYENIPFFGGYRDAHKFVALLAMIYVLGLAAGTWWVFTRLRSIVVQIGTAIIILALPITYTPLLFFGAAGQLQPRHYPRDWYSARQLLQADNSHYASLFLPWHLYMPFYFSERTIASPGPVFFGSSVYASTNPEIGTLRHETAGSVSAQIVNSLITPRDATSFAHQAAQFDIKYIIVAKSYDFKKYEFLHKAAGLRVIQNTHHMLVYKNMYWSRR